MLDLFDILGMGGESGYVTVEADDSMGEIGMMAATGSGTVGTLTLTIHWVHPNGITNMNWKVGSQTAKYAGNVEGTNKSIRQAYGRMILNGENPFAFQQANPTCVTVNKL